MNRTAITRKREVKVFGPRIEDTGGAAGRLQDMKQTCGENTRINRKITSKLWGDDEQSLKGTCGFESTV